MRYITVNKREGGEAKKVNGDMINPNPANTKQVMNCAPKMLIMKEEGTESMNTVDEAMNTNFGKQGRKGNEIMSTKVGVLPEGAASHNSSEELNEVCIKSKNAMREVERAENSD